MLLRKTTALLCALFFLLFQGSVALASGRTDAALSAPRIAHVGVSANASGTQSNRIIVKYKNSVSAATEQSVNGKFHAVNATEILPGVYVVTPPAGVSAKELAARYRIDASVEYAEPDYVVSAFAAPNDPYYAQYQTAAFKLMNILQAWDVSQGNSGIVVAVLDTGADFSHPDLGGRLLAQGYDFVNGDGIPADDQGHGTMCAGIISAVSNNAAGIAGAVKCSILPIKVLDANGSGNSSVLAQAIRYAVQKGADVISMSLGGSGDSQTVQDALDYAHQAGVVLVASSGNNNGAVNYPAANNHVIAVGAVTNSGVRASYSCYGSALDLVAVGSDVISTAWSGTGYSYLLGYGTSFSAPFVAALAALTLSVNAGMTPDQIETAMEKNATDLGASGWDQYYGAGCIDFYGTLAGQRDTVPPVITLRGESTVYVTVGSAYADAGATAYDNKDGDLSAFIAATSTVNAAIKGTYAVTYTVADSSGNKATAARSVIVKENAKPVITLNGAASLQVAFGSTYIDPGATAKDAEDGYISASITIDNPVNTFKAGTYKVTYTVTDRHGAMATATRTVVVRPNAKPVITILGKKTVIIKLGETYIDSGATARDVEDGDLTALIVTTGTVNTAVAGTYTVTYTVTDKAGATITAARRIIVQ